MLEEIEKAAAQLANTKTGWVTRRDAAELLGKAAARALVALHEHREEPDIDVKRSVDQALAEASAALKGIAPKVRKGSYSLEELARACEKPGQREVKRERDRYIIELRLAEDRTQKVYLEQFRRKDGIELIRVYTYCGTFTEKAAPWALRTNMTLAQGAVASVTVEGQERFALTNCFLAGAATPEVVKASVKEIAFYGDWIERRLMESDTF